MDQVHKNGEENQTAFECNVCGKAFSAEQGLKIHVSNVHVEPKIKCDICEKEGSEKYFLNEKVLRQHKHRIHLVVFKRPKRELRHCNKCNYTCFKKSRLENHIKTVHEGVKIREWV